MLPSAKLFIWTHLLALLIMMAASESSKSVQDQNTEEEGSEKNLKQGQLQDEPKPQPESQEGKVGNQHSKEKCVDCYHKRKVRELVGANFKKFVYDTEKHVLVLFYDPWQEEYESKWKAIYDQLAEDFKDDEEVAIMQIDHEPYEHMLKDEKIKKLPVIRLYRKGRNFVHSYKGKFTLEGLKVFLATKMAEEDPVNEEL